MENPRPRKAKMDSPNAFPKRYGRNRNTPFVCVFRHKHEKHYINGVESNIVVKFIFDYFRNNNFFAPANKYERNCSMYFPNDDVHHKSFFEWSVTKLFRSIKINPTVVILVLNYLRLLKLCNPLYITEDTIFAFFTLVVGIFHKNHTDISSLNRFGVFSFQEYSYREVQILCKSKFSLEVGIDIFNQYVLDLLKYNKSKKNDYKLSWKKEDYFIRPNKEDFVFLRINGDKRYTFESKSIIDVALRYPKAMATPKNNHKKYPRKLYALRTRSILVEVLAKFNSNGRLFIEGEKASEYYGIIENRIVDNLKCEVVKLIKRDRDLDAEMEQSENEKKMTKQKRIQSEYKTGKGKYQSLLSLEDELEDGEDDYLVEKWVYEEFWVLCDRDLKLPNRYCTRNVYERILESNTREAGQRPRRSL